MKPRRLTEGVSFNGDKTALPLPARVRKSRSHGGATFPPALILIFFAAALAFLSGACGRSRQDRARDSIIILGLDGLEWDFVLPMLKKDRLPNLAKLMRQGYFGELGTITPTLSPAIWTSIATGKNPGKHGIRSFFRYVSGNSNPALLQSADRKTKAIWNILSDYEKSIWSIGWWMTFPAEEINGIMVSQTNTLPKEGTPRGRDKKIHKGTLVKNMKGQVFPAGRQDEMMAILRQVDEDLPGLLRATFGTFRYSFSALEALMWENCRWAFRADDTYHRITIRLAKKSPLPDLTMLYLGGPDVTAHRYLRYARPEFFRHKPSKEQMANFGGIIEGSYAYCDRILGELMELGGPEATFFIISDHGMEAKNQDAEFNSDDPADAITSGGHKNAPPGFFLAAGPNILKMPVKKSLSSLTRLDITRVGTVLDIAPTVLAMLRIPVGKDMDGRVITEIFRAGFHIDRQPPAVASHDTAGFFSLQKKRKRGYAPDQDVTERLEQLRSLGYLAAEE